LEEKARGTVIGNLGNGFKRVEGVLREEQHGERLVRDGCGG
jgi:hypothetical protein